LKFFFVEGGEQLIVGIQSAKKIGIKATVRITIVGVFFAVILFFLLFYSRTLISTRWLGLALGITLYFFAASMFKEVLEYVITKPTTVEPSTTKQFLFLGVYEGELLRSLWATDTGSFFFPTGLVNDIVSNGKTWIH
jgi:hypothetical protein